MMDETPEDTLFRERSPSDEREATLPDFPYYLLEKSKYNDDTIFLRIAHKYLQIYEI
jgi:hypothetical protein